MHLMIYLDDILILNQNKMGLLKDRDFTLWLLQMLGFVINWEKSTTDSTDSVSGIPDKLR